MLTVGWDTVRVSKSPRNVRFSFNHRGLSHFGGAYFFHEFVRVLHVRHFLAEQIRYSRRNRDYSVSQMPWLWSIPFCWDWTVSRRLRCYVRTEPFST